MAHITDKGLAKIAVFQLDETTGTMVTATLTNGSNFMDLGEVISSNTAINATENTIKNEAKRVIYVEEEFEGVTEAVLANTSKLIQDFLAYTTRGTKWIEYKAESYANGYYQESWKIGKIVSQKNKSNPGGATSLNYKFITTPVEAAVTLSTTQIASMKTALGSTMIPAGTSPYPRNTLAVTFVAGQEDILTETA